MDSLQEREIEKVNAFYLQKEAEVRSFRRCRHEFVRRLILENSFPYG